MQYKIMLVLMVVVSFLQGQSKLEINRWSSNRAGIQSVEFNDTGEKHKIMLKDAVNTKSVGKAILLSAIFPGAGEYYLGHKSSGKFLMSLDLVLWGTFFGAGYMERTTVDNYKAAATRFAGVKNRDYDERYWIQIGYYDDIYQNNERELVNRNLDYVYTDTEYYYWSWDSEESRLKYLGLRVDAVDYSHIGERMAMGLFVDRLISVLNIIRISKKNKDRTSTSLSWSLKHYYSPVSGNYLGLQLVKKM